MEVLAVGIECFEVTFVGVDVGIGGNCVVWSPEKVSTFFRVMNNPYWPVLPEDSRTLDMILSTISIKRIFPEITFKDSSIFSIYQTCLI